MAKHCMWCGSAHISPIVLVFIRLKVAFQMGFVALIVYIIGNRHQNDQVEVTYVDAGVSISASLGRIQEK